VRLPEFHPALQKFRVSCQVKEQRVVLLNAVTGEPHPIFDALLDRNGRVISFRNSGRNSNDGFATLQYDVAARLVAEGEDDDLPLGFNLLSPDPSGALPLRRTETLSGLVRRLGLQPGQTLYLNALQLPQFFYDSRQWKRSRGLA